MLCISLRGLWMLPALYLLPTKLPALVRLILNIGTKPSQCVMALAEILALFPETCSLQHETVFRHLFLRYEPLEILTSRFCECFSLYWESNVRVLMLKYIKTRGVKND
jgi:hypothetical protein